MVVKYKNYTLVLDLSKNGILVPTFVKELNQKFKDVSQAKNTLTHYRG